MKRRIYVSYSKLKMVCSYKRIMSMMLVLCIVTIGFLFTTFFESVYLTFKTLCREDVVFDFINNFPLVNLISSVEFFVTP